MNQATAISQQIWDMKYRLKHGDEPVDRTVQDTFRRVAAALAEAEAPADRKAGPSGSRRR